MTKFGKLKKYDPKGRVSTLTLPIVTERKDGTRRNMRLHVLHAGDSNPAWRNAVNKHNAKTGIMRKMAMKATDTDEIARQRDRELYPALIITGWEDAYDDDGEAVAFSPETCREFLDELPNWIFDEHVRMYCAQAANFLADDEPHPGQIEDVAGN